MMSNQEEDYSVYSKLMRKFQKEPLVPLGAAVTVGCLLYGFRAFHRGDKKNAQVMMRARVVAQAFTVLAMGAGAAYGFKPVDRPKTHEEKMERERMNAVTR
jgi:Hypoxia induced protein conserved region